KLCRTPGALLASCWRDGDPRLPLRSRRVVILYIQGTQRERNGNQKALVFSCSRLGHWRALRLVAYEAVRREWQDCRNQRRHPWAWLSPRKGVCPPRRASLHLLAKRRGDPACGGAAPQRVAPR